MSGGGTGQATVLVVLLEVEKTAAELQESDRFVELQTRIEELEAQLETMKTEAEFDERLLPT